MCQLTLQRHKDQVWFCSFSPSSPHRFATLSKDGALHLYSISGSVVTQDLAILSYLECLSLAWSGQSDAYLLVGARDNCAYLFSSRDGSLVMKTSEHSKGVQQAIFTSDDARVLVLGQDQRLCVYNLGSRQLEESVQNVKLYEDMALVRSRDRAPMLVFSGLATLELRTVWKQEGISIEMDDNITAITASRDGCHLLCNISMSKPRIELLSFEGPSWGKSVQKYRGHQQSNYILRPQFGGCSENLVLCGSEDCCVLVWRRDSGELLMQLKNHFQIVNSISWSAGLNCLVSGSDDTTVKLWATLNAPYTLSVVRPAQIKSLNARMRLGESSESEKDEQADYRSQDEYMSEQDEADEDVEGWDLMTGMRH